MTKLQFQVLYRVFLLRVVDLELLADHGDSARLLGQFAALLSAISFLLSAWLIFFDGRFGSFPEEFLWTMEHLLIATTMVVVGLFSVLSWDSTFPDRRDILVLGPLPIPPRMLFVAKLTALAAALGLSILALNVFTGLVWPLVFFPATNSALASMRSLAAYWMTMLAASAFMFCSVLCVQWAAAQLLPRQIFLRLSALLQVTLFCLFLCVYFLEPSLETIGALSAPENQRLLAWLPSYWFLGLFQRLNGSMQPAFVPLATRAWTGLAISTIGAVAAYLLSYLRTLRKIVEQPDILPGSGRTKWSPRFGGSLQTAIAFFCLRTLLRSRQHRVILSFYLAVGFAVVLACVRPVLGYARPLQGMASGVASLPLLIASILMMSIAVLGVRIVCSMPIALRANWTFRITEIYRVPAYLSATRWSLFLLALCPVWVVFAALFLFIWPWKDALGHLVILAAVGIIVIDLSLYRFRKIPFTCSYLPGKGNVQFVFWACILVVLPLTTLFAKLELQALHNPARYAAVIAMLAIAEVFVRSRTVVFARSVKALTFEEVTPSEILGLGLQGDGGAPLEKVLNRS
jgi:hypothetical protein